MSTYPVAQGHTPFVGIRGLPSHPALKQAAAVILLVLLAASTLLCAAGAYQIRFREDLKVAADLRLSGNADSLSVMFRCERAVKPAEGSTLHLFIAHSPALDENRSYLTVTLNYGILRSVRLDGANESLTQVVIALPPGLLKPENELVFSVEQYPTRGGARKDLWTAISTHSYLVIQPDPHGTVFDLASLPAPFVDPYSYRRQPLDVLLPEQPAPETLEAMALIVANFCAQVGPEPVPVNLVRSITAARHPLLIVGTLGEQPQLRRVDRLGVALAEPEGLIGLGVLKSQPPVPVLFATGGTPAAVLRAARELALRNAPLSGVLVKVAAESGSPVLRLREWKGFIPPDNRFTLATLGFRELRLTSQDAFAVTIPLDATPDARFLPNGPQMTLSFRLHPVVSTWNCMLVVELNDAPLASMPVREAIKGPTGKVTIKIPARRLQSRNILRIALAGPLENAGQPWAGSLLPDSQFYLPRDYKAELPDLALLRHHLFPFSLNAELADTIVLLPPRAGQGAIAALIELASQLGRLAPADRVSFRVRRAGEVPRKELASSNVIFLGAAGPGTSPAQVFPNWLRPPLNASARLSTWIQEAVSPWNANKFVLSVTANSMDALPQAVDEVFRDAVLAHLSGDAAHLTPRGVNCFALGPKRALGQYDYSAHLEAWLRTNWMALPLILTVASGVLFVGLRLALDRYKRDRAARKP